MASETPQQQIHTYSKSLLRQQRHSSMNDILRRAPTTKEPANLILQNGKRLDGSTLIPWSRGKPMAWDVTVPDTYAMQNHTLATLPQRQVQRRTRPRPTKSQNMMKWPARTSSTQLPYKQEVPGITGQFSLSRKLADGPHWSLANQENAPFCFSSCQ